MSDTATALMILLVIAVTSIGLPMLLIFQTVQLLGRAGVLLGFTVAAAAFAAWIMYYRNEYERSM